MFTEGNATLKGFSLECSSVCIREDLPRTISNDKQMINK